MKNIELTQDRADILSGILSSEQGSEIFALEANDALKKINGGFGHSFDRKFTLGELNEFVRAVGKAVAQSRLSDRALAGVAGGVDGDVQEDLVITITAAGVAAAGKFLGGAGALVGGTGVLIGALRG